MAQCEELFLIIFLVRCKQTSGFLKLVLQHKRTVARASRDPLVWGRLCDNACLGCQEGSLSLTLSAGAGGGGDAGTLSLRTAPGMRPVIWGRAGRSCTSQYQLGFSP